MSIWFWLSGGCAKPPDKWDCKWIKPSKYAWWEWQSCTCPDHPHQEYKCDDHPDFSCNYEKDCTCFEAFGAGEKNWEIKKDIVVEKEKK